MVKCIGEEKGTRKETKIARMAILKTWRGSRYMDKRQKKDSNSASRGSPRTISQGDSEENPRSIVVWKDGKFWLIYDQTNNVMTQGLSYEDAIYMLSDALKELKKD